MATDFWASTHYNRWIVDRATLKQARVDDLQYVDDPEHLEFLAIFFANVISKLGKKLQLRQRVIATATVFFRRFYVKNSYCETDPFMVIAACCYVAAKAEESPVHIKNVVTEARSLFNHENYGVKSFPSDNSKLAEMEFYLVDDLECDLVIFHPYRTLMTLCRKEGNRDTDDTEAGELGAGIDTGPRYWGSGDGQLELQEGALQMAWFIINDTYRSQLCLLYPPHLIAIAAIYLTLVLHAPTHAALKAQRHAPAEPDAPAPEARRRSARKAPASAGAGHKPAQDPVGFLAGLNVSMPLVATLAQEILALYALWDRYKEDGAAATADSARSAFGTPGQGSPYATPGGLKRTLSGTSRSGSTGVSNVNTPMEAEAREEPAVEESVVSAAFLVQLLVKMRENRQADLAHPASGRPTAVNKMLERTQAAGW
ncbi:cyclin-like protein [Athelia psychrophila]|uniref:Cyclin-like protein n=1 Tax=Athelia psychrophila TaxID=1759441 RepID=A0A165WPL6_9AGAM|nr:cyclin-like protein [Fibularhizoctonia sp. CBS 109695]